MIEAKAAQEAFTRLGFSVRSSDGDIRLVMNYLQQQVLQESREEQENTLCVRLCEIADLLEIDPNVFDTDEAQHECMLKLSDAIIEKLKTQFRKSNCCEEEHY